MKRKTEIGIPVETADCVIRHINIFIKQNVENREADFGEPCQNCKHIEKCRCDWQAKILPLLNLSNEKIQLCYKMEEKTIFKLAQNMEESRNSKVV